MAEIIEKINELIEKFNDIVRYSDIEFEEGLYPELIEKLKEAQD
jgi:hypothetical protein